MPSLCSMATACGAETCSWRAGDGAEVDSGKQPAVLMAHPPGPQQRLGGRDEGHNQAEDQDEPPVVRDLGETREKTTMNTPHRIMPQLNVGRAGAPGVHPWVACEKPPIQSGTPGKVRRPPILGLQRRTTRFPDPIRIKPQSRLAGFAGPADTPCRLSREATILRFYILSARASRRPRAGSCRECTVRPPRKAEPRRP